MKTIIALVVLAASVSTATANGVSSNDIYRYVTPNQIAQLTAEEVRMVQGLISTGKSRSEIRAKVRSFLD